MTVIDVAELMREIVEVRRGGVAYDDGEYNAEVRCVAVPVYGFTGPIWRLSIQLLKEKSKLVRSAAARLSKEFGSAPEPETPRAPEKFRGGQAKSR